MVEAPLAAPVDPTPDSAADADSLEPSSFSQRLSPHFPDEPRGRVVIGKKATHLSRIREHHSW